MSEGERYVPFTHVIQTTIFCWVLGFAIPKAATSFITVLLLVTLSYCRFYQLRRAVRHGNWLWLGKG